MRSQNQRDTPVFIHHFKNQLKMKRQLFIEAYQSNEGLWAIKKRRKMEFNAKFKFKI